MLDRLLMGGLWLTIMGLIMFTAGSSLFLGYRGLFHLLSRQYPAGLTTAGCGIALGIACYSLVRHGDDLMDR